MRKNARPRLRTVSENFLNVDGYLAFRDRLGSDGERVITSSWEVPKINYGRIRASPSPSPAPTFRHCMDSMPGPATKIQTYHVTSFNNSLSRQVDQQNKVFKTVKDFVDEFAEDESKKRYISKILVATNGIAAVKCILSMRKLMMQLFKDDHKIKFICLTTEQEIQSKAEYLKMADHIVFSPAGANNNNYANVDEIVEHAVRQGVDAVWAGWGHASENPKLPEELAKRNILFIGPPSNAMFALGDKIASTIIAQTENVPTIEWSGSGLVVPDLEPTTPGQIADPQEVSISKELYAAACVSSWQEGLEVLKAKNITYPVMIKASEGGGGKGIRRCNNDEEFRINFHRVEAEVPGSPIFLMRCMENARHIEVQLIADQYGNVIPIFTRDCSIQRRCQKIIEEAPASIAPPEVLRNMQQDAVNLAKRVGYASAGTVEYLYLPETQKYYFLELNPRLQVEHPCTEMVANINIPAIQLQIAMGLPLHRIVDIRLFYAMDRYGTTSLPDDQIKTDTNIAVIAARITSEDPAEGFRPASGSVEYLNFQSNQNVWGYFSVSSSGKVHEYADSQFGHLFAKGSTRYEAISAMLCALKELELRATFTSQVNYLVGLLQSPEFEGNKFHTGWLDARIASKVQSVPELPRHVTIAVGATVIGHARITEVFSKFQNAIERGQILPTSELTETWEVELVHNNVKYSVLVNRYGPINFLVCLNDSKVHTEVRELGNGELLVTYADQCYQCHLDEEAERYKLSINRTQTIFEKENDPSRLRSRNAGRLLQYLKKDGEYVGVGEVFAEMESMKMVIALEVKKAGGRLKQIVQPGQALYPGTIIAELEGQDDSASVKPTEFKTQFPEWVQAEEQRLKANIRLNTKFENLLQACQHILSGYSVPESMYKTHVKKLVDDLFAVMNDNKLPFAMFKVMLHVVETRIRSVETYNKIKDLIKEETHFQATELTEVMENYLSSLNPADLGMEKQWFEALLRICEKFENGAEGHKQMVVKELLETFLSTEKYFQEVTYDQGVSNLKGDVLKDNKEESHKAVRMVYSHTRVHAKNLLLREMVSRLDDSLVTALKPTLQKISNLFNAETEPLALYVRELLNKMHQTSYDQICNKISKKNSEKSLSELIKVCSEDGGDTVLKTFLNGSAENKMLLHEFFFTANRETNIFAIKQYIRQTFYIEENDIEVITTSTAKATIFKFEIKPFTPLYPNTVQNPSNPEKVLYFMSVLSQLDLFRCEEILSLLKQHAQAQAKNNFLFVAFPKGENGFTTAMQLPEPELRKLGLMLKDEVTKALERNGVPSVAVDLMLSRPAHPPLYTQFDFSAKEKLELYRLPTPTENVSVANSPYLLFKYNEKGIVRLFARYLLRDVASVVQTEKYSRANLTDLLKNKLVDVLDGACGEIRVSTHSDKTITINDCNHILVCVDYDPSLKTSDWWKASVHAIQQCERYLVKHRVTEVEIVYKDAKPQNAKNGKTFDSIKVVYTNETGAISEYAVYRVNDNKLEPLGHVDGPCRNAGESSFAVHHSIPQVQVQKKRFQAHKLGTTYVYDFPVVFGRAILDAWKQYKITDPNSFNKIRDTLPEKQLKALANHDYHGFVQAKEMLLDDKTDEIALCDDEEILKRRANSAENDRGMIAWKMNIWTPDAPKGRKVVVIANDITYQMGSFSMREHKMYKKASEFSRKHKLPRVYIAANSGARIGFAMDVKKRLNVVWKDKNNPIEMKYLAVDNEGPNDPVLEQVEHTLVDGNQRIDAVVGKENDIGVENLVGSGLIAGETSAAYKEVPTYCLVTGRSVGIGAYVARLSHRICQVENSHLILTGAPALNSLLGREIYASNGQLGGIQIMHKNGVSHAVAQNDLEGVNTILRWISFLPVPSADESSKLTPMLKDDEARGVVPPPSNIGEQDIRQLLDPQNGGGLFDKNSFDEIMSEWAKTIVTGRARIRGLPVGVVAVETRTVKFEIPADPATADSQAKTMEQAGRVWYPDSAYKTAEAINDFNKEGLPLIFVANIRGFSGGQKDMFDMVLKFGACIVDALQSYTQPIIVYLPPYGELRGGAWAVLDTQINPTCITMLADPDSRGGVLEPKGIVEIKFRANDLKTLMKKCDPLMAKLEKELGNEKLSKEENDKILKEIEKRREFLMPIYRAIAEKFADLHDTTARMLAKGAIHDEVPWTEARNYFYELFQVEMAKMRMAREYLVANGKSEPLNIEELSEGYKWVAEHLKEQSVTFSRPVVSSVEEGKHRRHEYFSEQIVSYSQSGYFKRVLEQIIVRRSSSMLQDKLGKLAENTRQSLVSEILSSVGEEVRNKVLFEQLAALSAADRENLFKQFNKAPYY